MFHTDPHVFSPQGPPGRMGPEGREGEKGAKVSTPLGWVLVPPEARGHSPEAGLPLPSESPDSAFPILAHFREMLVLTGPQAGQAPLGPEGPLDGLGLMVFQGSLVLW